MLPELLSTLQTVINVSLKANSINLQNALFLEVLKYILLHFTSAVEPLLQLGPRYRIRLRVGTQNTLRVISLQPAISIV